MVEIGRNDGFDDTPGDGVAVTAFDDAAEFQRATVPSPRELRQSGVRTHPLPVTGPHAQRVLSEMPADEGAAEDRCIEPVAATDPVRAQVRRVVAQHIRPFQSGDAERDTM